MLRSAFLVRLRLKKISLEVGKIYAEVGFSVLSLCIYRTKDADCSIEIQYFSPNRPSL
jgi:hypothetical protein